MKGKERNRCYACILKNWGIIVLQCVSFCCEAKWVGYMYTYIPSLLKPPSHPLLLNPSRSSQSSQLSFLLCLHFGLSYWVVKPCMELREIREEAGLGGEWPSSILGMEVFVRSSCGEGTFCFLFCSNFHVCKQDLIPIISLRFSSQRFLWFLEPKSNGLCWTAYSLDSSRYFSVVHLLYCNVSVLECLIFPLP